MFVIRTSFRTHDPDEVPSLGCPSNQEPTLNKRGTTITTCLDFLFFLRLFQFFLCSQHVPFKFPMGSLRVFPIAPFFNPICFAQKSYPSHLHRWAQEWGIPSFHRIFYLGGVSLVSTIFFWDGLIKLTHCKKKKKELDLWVNPQLINMKQNK
jgi:hypothetical protein